MSYVIGYLKSEPQLCPKPCGVCMLCKCCELEIDKNCKLRIEKAVISNKCKPIVRLNKLFGRSDNSKSDNIKKRSGKGKRNV